MVEKIKQALERAYKERTGVTRRIPPGADMLSSLPDAEGWALTDDTLNNAEIKNVDTQRLAKSRVITFDNSDEGVESYRLLRTQLIRRMQTDQLSTIGITSPNANEGKTLTSVNLAISLAKSADIGVILIDGDITHPSVHDVLGVNSEYGLIDLLKRNISPAEAIVKINIPNLWLIPGRYENASLLDQTNLINVEGVVKSLAFSDRILVIVDLPPVLSKDDTLAIAACLDGVILVVQEGSTKSNEVSRSVELLKQGNLIGTVMNKYSRHQKTYY